MKSSNSDQNEPLDFSVKTSSFSERNSGSTDPITSVDMAEEEMTLCQICDHVARNYEDIESHMLMHVDEKLIRAPRCANCGTLFNTIDELNQHFALYHQKILAQKSAQTRYDAVMTTHQELSPQQGADMLYKYLINIRCTQARFPQAKCCVVCGIMFRNNQLLSQHFEDYHGSMFNPYKPLKGEATPRDSPCDVTSPFSCNQCSFGAQSMSDLARHQIMHSLSRAAHVCTICGLTTKSEAELTSHFEEEHATTTELETGITFYPGFFSSIFFF